MIEQFVGRRRRRGGHRARRRGRDRARLAAWLLYAATSAIPLLLVLAALVATVIVGLDTVAWAQDAPEEPGVSSIPEVVNRMRIWLVGILVAVSTLFLTVGGFRYLWSNGDPGEVEKAKTALRNAAIGYALAILAPLFVTIVTSFVD
jgi:uncharacterized membrane protein YjgN (DUF898 family)